MGRNDSHPPSQPQRLTSPRGGGLTTSAAAASHQALANLMLSFRQLGHTGRFTWSLPFVVILASATIVYLCSFWLDVLFANVAVKQHISFTTLTYSLLNQDVDQARNTLGGLGEVMAAVLGLALTVSSIIVQLAATRFTPHVTTMFFRARTNQFVLGFFVTSSIYVLWVNFSVGHDYVPHWGVFFSMVLMTTSLLLLFPYFAYVFDFLDPEKIVGRIMTSGLTAATPTKSGRSTNVDARQARAVRAIEQLANIGLNALQQKDKGIASDAVDSLGEFGIRYGTRKAAMPMEWQRIPGWNRQSPDFVSLSDEAIEDLRHRETWVEWKILRQCQMLFVEALGQIKDTCYLIAIDTRRLGEAAGRRGDIYVLDLTIKFFNTYLRAGINASDVRTVYNVLHQYRQLAEFLLVYDDTATSHFEGPGALEDRALQIARFMRYYSATAFGRGATFVTEVIAHDISNLCELAFLGTRASHDELLQIFLSVDEHADTKEQEKSLRGVRRAQVKLATTYLVHKAPHLARRVRHDMADEPLERLRSIWQELEALEHREFWEVNDRGTNFDYLTPAQKAQLETFFSWFPGLEWPGHHTSTPLTP